MSSKSTEEGYYSDDESPPPSPNFEFPEVSREDKEKMLDMMREQLKKDTKPRYRKRSKKHSPYREDYTDEEKLHWNTMKYFNDLKSKKLQIPDDLKSAQEATLADLLKLDLNTAKGRRKRKRKTNKARGKGNKITKKQTKNKCPTRQKRKTSWIVQNSRRYINAFKRTKIPGEIFNFNKIIQVMEEAMLDGGYWIVQWKFNRSPGKYGHYFLSFDDEYPLDVKAKNKNIYTANIGGYKKSKTRKRNRKRRSRKTRK